MSSSITRRAEFQLRIHDAYRDSFVFEDDAIYGDAGGVTPTDANGDPNSENEEEVHESDAGAEEEEEDSEDVSQPFQTRHFS